MKAGKKDQIINNTYLNGSFRLARYISFFIFTIMKSTEPYILGVDIGTSSTKALAWTISGTITTQHQIKYQSQQPKPDAEEQSPKALLNATIGVIKAVVKEQGQPIALSFSFAMHGIMAVDKRDTPISPLLLWNDNRSKKEAAHFKEKKEATRFYEHTGTPIHPMSPFCKLLWWKKNKPETFHKAGKFISFQEYLFSQFFGGYYISHSLASATGLFDHKKLDWYTPALDLIGITKEKLATPLPSTHLFKGLQSDYAHLLGLDRNVPFVLGAGDGCLANIGSGVINKDQMAVTIGTSGAVRITDKVPIPASAHNPGSLFNYLLTEKEYISGGAINNGGNLLDWYKHNFLSGEQQTYHQILQEAFKAKAGCRGLLFLPYLYGERAPMWDPDARGCFWGIASRHERKDFTRAIIEGICYALFHNAKILMDATQKSPSQICVSGGFVHSKPWLQMLSDIFQKQVIITNQADISSMGAVFLGLKALGRIQDWSEIIRYCSPTEALSPQRDLHPIYKRNFSLYSKMYELTQKAMHEACSLGNQQ